MQNSVSQQLKRLRAKLRIFLKNKEIVDIFIIGSALKEKLSPKDIDVIVLFRKKDLSDNGEIMYKIKKESSIDILHIEPLIVDEMFNTKIFPSLIHEGYSIKHNKRISELIGYKSYSLFTFSLGNLEGIDKVRFSQALYGRKNDGLLKKEKGRMLGKGVFIAPVEKEELFRELLLKHEAKFEVKRTFVKD